jgi:ferritin-like metal-binding protein YciE
MGIFSKDIQSLDDLFEHDLKDIYYAENQILKALPQAHRWRDQPAGQEGPQGSSEGNRGTVARLEQIFEMREEKPKGTKCYGINGLLTEGDELTG